MHVQLTSRVVYVAFLLILICIIPQSESRNWFKWFRTMGFVRRALKAQRPLGLVGPIPKKFSVVTDNIVALARPQQILDAKKHGPKQIELLSGHGFALKGHVAGIMLKLPRLKKQRNYCGLVIVALTALNSAYISKLKLFWRNPTTKWDALASPKTGEKVYFPRMRAGLHTRVILFDSVPATQIHLTLGSVPGKNINFKAGFLTDCKYKKTIVINNCGEMVDRNVRFALLPMGVPISIKCPLDCVRTWPCWGYKIYSSDSPICWTATQNFGRYGSGIYTMYRIPKILYFRQNINSIETHGIYCRRSTVIYEGYTFDRKYYDFARIEYRDKMGA